MKKVLLLVGILSIGLYANYQVEAKEENEQVTVLKDIEENDGEASGEIKQEDSVSKQRGLARAAATRTIDIKRFYIEVTDGAANSDSVPITNSKFTVSYVHNNRSNVLYEGMTNEKGEILNLPTKEIPFEVKSLNIRFTLGNDERGYVQRFNKNPYRFTFTIGFNMDATANTINFGNRNVKFGNTADPESPFYNFQAIRMNHYFDQAVQEYSNAVKMANDLLPETVPFTLEPINFFFEKGQYLEGKNRFYSKGHDSSGTSTIVLGDKSNKKFTTNYLKRNVMHEWTHWNMGRTIGLTKGGYNGHYGYNSNPQTSFKEGWALFVDEVFGKNYNLDRYDLLVQNDNSNGVNRLYGKSTNLTVQHVLYDLLDTGSKDEEFNVSERYQDEELSDLEIRRLNLGIMHTLMVESKATTLQEYLNYVESKYVLTKADKAKFAKVLEANGLSREGAFTLDNEGNALSTPLQANEKTSLDVNVIDEVADYYFED
ncbi:hypothetical protein P7E02_19400 [Enterococcus hulanensis]|uniref:hypothetical protein n=1 Tax=Enterococcus hulanensis TaxID=2559929 RepID=UPI00288D32EB|nr:hypothetical protein [Enterococcus hulanensis]MDT2662055.1 hypothetical protein [Enterococcus hulanensis]